MLRRNDHENDHLQKAWNCHGWEAFSFVVLLICSPSDSLYYEQRILDYYKSKIGWRQMYNCNPDVRGRRGSMKSAEERAKISERMKGNKYTLGYCPTPETRAKLAVATRRRNLGSKLSEETKRKIGDANRGRLVSAETRAKLSAAGKGRKLSAEHLAKLAASSRFSGRRHSEESRDKISRGVRAWQETEAQ